MALAHTFTLFWSQCLSESVRGVSWDLTLTNLFLVIVRFAIERSDRCFQQVGCEDLGAKKD